MGRPLKTEFQTLVRRSAAKLLGDYAPPPLSHTDALLQELQEATAREQAAGEWSDFTAAIRAALQGGANQFLRLRPIAKTVHPRIRSHSGEYLQYVLSSKRFTPALQKALTESPIGQPLVNPHYPLSSPLLVQHAFHLIRLLELTDFDLASLQLAVDFGGGYGSFFRLLRNLGYRNRYLICDLPVMCALQRFYLRNLFPTGADGQPPENLSWLSGNAIPRTLPEETSQHSPSLFVATWSLSETPIAIRDQVVPALAGFNYVLLAYQRTFGTNDNAQYFSALEGRLPGFRWQHHECPIYKGNFYLVGRRG